MSEKIPKTNPESDIEKKELSQVKKFKILLNLFGTDKARSAFLETCESYLSARAMHSAQVNTGDAENYRPKKTVTYSPPKRADTHNKIMEIISKIATEIKNPTPEQSQILKEFFDREVVAQAMMEYFKHKNDKEYYKDDDEPEVNRRDMSDTAYFHSLGKEH